MMFMSCVVSTYLYDAFDCMFLSGHGNKILSRNSRNTLPRFGDCRISMREVNISLFFIRILPEKNTFLWGGLGSSSIILHWH